METSPKCYGQIGRALLSVNMNYSIVHMSLQEECNFDEHEFFWKYTSQNDFNLKTLFNRSASDDCFKKVILSMGFRHQDLLD